MTPCEMTAAITALANLLAARLSEEELGLLAAQLTQLGDTLTTIAVCTAARASGELNSAVPPPGTSPRRRSGW